MSNFTSQGLSQEDFAHLREKGRQALALALELTKIELWRNLRIETPVDHGRAANSWQMETLNEFTHKVYTNVQYIKFLSEGTGIYGPRKTPIVPKTAKALKWVFKGKTYIAKGDLITKWQKARFIEWAEDNDMIPLLEWPKGIKPNDFIERSINKTEQRTQEFIHMAIQQTI